MSEPQPTGFKGFLWTVAAALIVAAAISLFSWAFPSVDIFFAKSGAAASNIWAGLTFTHPIPAVPLGLGIVLGGGTMLRQAIELQELRAERAAKVSSSRDETARFTADTELLRNFSKAEKQILVHLLHAEFGRAVVDDVVNTSRMPRLVIEDAGESLIALGCIERNRGANAYYFQYELTEKGKGLVLAAWRNDYD